MKRKVKKEGAQVIVKVHLSDRSQKKVAVSPQATVQEAILVVSRAAPLPLILRNPQNLFFFIFIFIYFFALFYYPPLDCGAGESFFKVLPPL